VNNAGQWRDVNHIKTLTIDDFDYDLTAWIDSNACFPRRTFSMMASGSAVQGKGLGLSLVSARYRLMAALRSTMPLKTPRLSRCRGQLAKNPSTATRRLRSG
jgi:hypothetical protein